MDEDFFDEEENYSGQGNLPSQLKLYTFFLLMFQALFRLSDTAMNVLFRFFAMFFATLGQHVPALPQTFVSNLPKTKYAACSVLTSSQSFTKFVCCPSCHSIYQWDICTVHTEVGQRESKLCSFQEFPNHPQPRHRNQCGQPLMKKKIISWPIVTLSTTSLLLLQCD